MKQNFKNYLEKMGGGRQLKILNQIRIFTVQQIRTRPSETTM